MSNKIYCCSTYYHVLIACVKVLVEKENADLLLTDYIPECELLFERVRKTTVFQKVFFVKQIEEYTPENLFDKVLYQHKRNTKRVEQQLECKIKEYSSVYLFHDDTWIARYCKDAKIQHILLEDALDSYKIIDKTQFAYQIPRTSLKTLLKKVFSIGYAYGEYDKYTVQIEINDDKDVKIPLSDKVKVVPRADLFGRLTAEDENTILKIFPIENMMLFNQKKALILTQPLYVDGMVQTEEEQIKIYSKIIKKYLDKSYTVVIKPHPRDLTEYKEVFKNCNVMDKNMPIEMLNYCGGIEFDIGVTLFSTAINGLSCVKKKIVLGYK